MSIVDQTATTTGSTPSSSALPPTRVLYWSIRREIWEHRSVYIAPLAVAALVLFGFLIRIARLPREVHAVASKTALEQSLILAAPFGIVGVAIAATGLIVALLYCLGALYGERRDRSVLFWKSLPVSDLITIAAKASIPLVVLPAVVCTLAIAAQLIMLVIGSVALAGSGMGADTLWSHWPILKMAIVEIYGIVVLTLWYAPIYGWILLVSSWARSMPVLWAVLPPLAIAIAERIAFETKYVSHLLSYRLGGYVAEGFDTSSHEAALLNPLTLMAPGRFFSSPGLWLGLAVAAAFLAATVWMRRNRDLL